MKHLTKEILDEDEKNTKRDLEHLNQICGHLHGMTENVSPEACLVIALDMRFLALDLQKYELLRTDALETLSKIAEARKRLGL